MSWAEAKWVVDSLLQKIGTTPNNMRMFKAFSLSKTSIGLQWLEPADSYAGDNLICAIGGVMIRMSKTGYPKSITDGTLVIDNKNLGAYESENYVIDGLTEGDEYYFSAFPYSHEGVYNQYDRDDNRANCVVGANVYGIRRDITSMSPTWTRTDLAQRMTATASVGTVAGYSDFSDVMPWAGIQRETLATGDVMVKIPKFYYQRTRSGNIEYIRIADNPRNGFKIHPLFYHGGVETDCAYIGAYMTSTDTFSKPNEAANNARNIAIYRSLARDKGAGWGITDMAALSAIQMLFLVEFATYDSQSVIGKGRTEADSALMTGTCDSVPNLTGRPADEDGQTDVVWRGIETLWGCRWEYIDGINAMNTASDYRYFVCNDMSKYNVDTFEEGGYEPLSYGHEQLPGGSTAYYITELGLDEGENDHVMLPVAAGKGSASTYICDATKNNGYAVFRFGGNNSFGTASGLFSLKTTSSASVDGESASRLMYIPQ
jgi:hypothetical protein